MNYHNTLYEVKGMHNAKPRDVLRRTPPSPPPGTQEDVMENMALQKGGEQDKSRLVQYENRGQHQN